MAEDLIEKVAESPAVALDKTIETTKKVNQFIGKEKYLKKAREFWYNLGPGLTTGAADDDPSGIATYSQTGAQYGLNLLWLAIFTLPFMAIIQEMCARIGLVTGKGLAANIRKYFPRWVIYLCSVLLFITNTLNLGADIGAMAKATQLLFNAPFELLVVGFTVIILGLQIFTTYNQFAKYLKFLALILTSYILTGLLINVNWADVLRHAVLPTISFNKNEIFLICGILGTTISPYLFFWQTSQEVEEKTIESRAENVSINQLREVSKKEIKDMRVDVWSGMFVSNLVMFFIIMTTAVTLFSHGITNINSAADAASALKPLAGKYAYLLFTLGIIGTGVLAVPVLAGSASYAFSESMGWKFGLYRKLKHAYSFYGVIIFSMIIGLLINFIGFDPIKALIYSAVLNGLIAPIILLLIVLISSSSKVMGDYTNKPFITMMGYLITGVMILAGLATIVSLIMG